MNLKFRVSKLANFFFFISNLSEWHFSCRKAYNEAWLRATGSLTVREKAILRQLSTVLQKYGFITKGGKAAHPGAFYLTLPERRAQSAVQKLVTKEEYKILEASFSTLKNRFEKWWHVCISDMDRIRMFKEALRERGALELFRNVENVLGKPPSGAAITVIALFSPLGVTETAAGGANAGSYTVTIELPRIRPGTWQCKYSVGILAHEICHALLNKSMLRTLMCIIRTFRATSHGNLVSLVMEAVVSSFVPVGYLGQRYAPRHFGEIAFSRIHRAYQLSPTKGYDAFRTSVIIASWKLYPLAAEYGMRKKKLDRRFLLEAIREITKQRG